MDASRIRKVQQSMEGTDFAAMAFNAGPSLGWLTGLHFHLMERPVVLFVPAQGIPCLVLPELECQKLVGLSFELHSFAYGDDPQKWSASFAQGLEELSLTEGCVGMEPGQMRLLEYNLLRKASPLLSFKDGSSLIAPLRMIKDEQEIAAHRRAVRVAETALERTLPKIQMGITEKEIAAELFCQLLKSGSDSTLPFEPIVASGPNGANPHAAPTDRRLVDGDLLIIDWGACCDGYVSDLTRTFGIGAVGEKEQAIFQAVLAANRAGRAAGGPGQPCAKVDEAARDCIVRAGYGSFFTHRTGHGLGLECHEEPYIYTGNSFILQPGMTYTVEPGIYLPGQNGVRIEDDVLVTEQGCESLSSMERDLVLLG